VAHHERATPRVGDAFPKLDADQTRSDVEVQAMTMAPIPTPQVLWRKPLCCSYFDLKSRGVAVRECLVLGRKDGLEPLGYKGSRPSCFVP
jgi:hypothetical protein